MYVDGFVLPVKRARLDEYLKFAREAGELSKKNGALQYVECVADDVAVGEVTSFPRSVKLEDDEVVVFSWITYASRADRDRINATIMAELDPPDDMPVDTKRMIFGGFEARITL